MPETCIHGVIPIEGVNECVICERDRLQAQVATLTAERDEARSDATRECARADAAVEGAAGMRGRLEAAEKQVAAVRGLLPRWLELAEAFASDPGAGELTAGATTAVRAAVRKLAAIVGDAGEGDGANA